MSSFDPHKPSHARAATDALGHWHDDVSPSNDALSGSELAAHEAGAPGSHASGHQPAGVAGPARSTGLAAPDRFELGDFAVGTTHFENRFVFNSEPTDANVRVFYEGSPAIALVASPDRLHPSHDGFDPGTALRFAFTPPLKGHFQGMLTVEAAWPAGGRAAENVQIPIEAAAHAVGEPDLAVQEADQRARDGAQRKADVDRREAEHAKAAHEDGWKKNHLPGTEAAREELRDATAMAEYALGRLLATRDQGVTAAEASAKSYHERQVPHHESLLETLALAALDVATAGISGALGKRLEAALVENVVLPAQTVWSTGKATAEKRYNPGKAVVAFFTDSVKDGVKRGGKIAHPGTKTGSDHANAASGAIAVDAFFGTEHNSLVSDTATQARQVAENARLSLEPMLAHSQEQAVGAMRAISSAISATAEDEMSARTQERESGLHWMRYVADAQLGTTKTGATDIDAGNEAPSEHQSPHRVDGLVDLEFTANAARPEDPVILQRVRVHGISNHIARLLKERPLLAAHVPLRAYGVPTGVAAATPLEAIRDESGNIQIVDNTGVAGSGNWFARRAGDPNGGPDAALRGAGSVFGELAQQADDQFSDGTNPETDSND